MKKTWRRARALTLGLVLPVVAGRTARADEIAPELETIELREKARAELKKLVFALERSDAERLVGVYLAVDTSPTDPNAMVACDDDGDYAIVITDAMLRLAAFVARATGRDEADGTRSVEDYAAFLDRSQVPGRRLLPPPPGFYTATNPSATDDERLREALSFILARELAHLRAGDLRCPYPTATRERGDDEWTAAEQRFSRETAARIYPGDAAPRDTEATTRMLEAGRKAEGALGLLRFFAELEGRTTQSRGRFAPTYLAIHPNARARLARVTAAVEAHRVPLP